MAGVLGFLGLSRDCRFQTLETTMCTCGEPCADPHLATRFIAVIVPTSEEPTRAWPYSSATA
eukprot:5730443-Alexandrium_andersonii.AAC.1